MKTLIVYYSRSNTTKKVAHDLKNKLNCDIEEIKTTINYSGPLGYAKGIKDSIREKIIPINPLKYNVDDYDKIIIAMPVWTSKLPNPILTYVNENKNHFKNIDLIIVGKSNGFEKVEEHFTKVSGIKAQHSVYLLEKEINNNKFDGKIKELL